MKNKILLFGMLADAVGQPFIEVSAVSDTEALRRKIGSEYPELERFPFAIAVNRKVVPSGQTIDAGAELALLPPFAGG